LANGTKWMMPFSYIAAVKLTELVVMVTQSREPRCSQMRSLQIFRMTPFYG
jgi:hypothetical protein